MMMKSSMLAAGVLAAAVLAAGVARAEPFAEKVVPPAGIKTGSPEAFGAQMLAAATVPDRAKVPVPPYPGAKVIAARGGTVMEVNGEKVQCLPYIKLHTADPAEKVEAFYKKELQGYRFQSKFGGMFRVFWSGASDLNPMDVTQMCTTPNVNIGDALPDGLMPAAKTAIEIGYRPN